MKTEMSEDGVITIKPENSVEAYALRRWSDSARIQVDDQMRCETGYWKDSKLCIDASWPINSGTGAESPVGFLNFTGEKQ